MFVVKIEDGVVTTVGRLAEGQDTPKGWLEIEQKVGIGWTFDGTTFAQPAVVTPEQTLVEWRDTAALPRGKFCMALVAASILPSTEAIAAARGEWPETFNAAFDKLSTEEAVDAQIEWATTQLIRRNHPLIAMLGELAGLKVEQIDELFGRTA